MSTTAAPSPGQKGIATPDVESQAAFPSSAQRASADVMEGHQPFFTRNNAAMLQIDPVTGKILDANEAAAQFYGWPVATLSSMAIQDINCLPPEDIAAERQAAALENRNYFVFPHRLASGEIRTVEVHSTPITRHGHVVLWSIVHDITERRAAEARIKSLLAEQEAILSSDLVGVCMLKDRRFLWVNPEFARMFGYPAEELIGQPTFVLYPDASSHVAFAEAAYSAMSKGGTFRTEWQYRRRDGSLGWFAISGARVEVNPATSFWAFLDITARKEAEVRLAGERLRVETILQTAADGIHVLDRNGTLVEANDAFLRMLGHGPDAIGRLNVKDWDASDQWNDLIQRVQTLIESRDALLIETVHRRDDGSLLDVEINVRGISIGGVGYLYASSRDITERRRLAREVEDLYNRAPCGYHSLDTEGFYVRVNDTELEWLGCSRDEVVGKLRPTDFLTAEGKALFQQSYPAFLRDGRIHGLEFELISRTGEIRWVSVSASSIRAPDGRVVQTRSVMHDITARRQADLALRASRSELLQAQKIAQLGSWRWIPATGVNVWSEEQYRIFGVRPGTHTPSYDSFMAAVHPDDRMAVSDFLGEVLDGKRELSRLEFRIVRPTGEVRHVRADATAQRDQQGAITEMIGTTIDVTDLTSAREQAREAGDRLARELESSQFSEARLRSVLDSMSEGIVLMNREGCIVEANPAAETILGLSRQHLLGPDQAVREIATVRLDGSPYPTEQHPANLALTTGRSCRHEIMGVMIAGAGQRWLSINAAPIFTAADPTTPMLAVATFEDVTDQRRADQALRESDLRRRLAMDGSREGLWDWDLPTGRVHFSEGWKRLLGYAGDEIGERLDEWSGRVHPDDLDHAMGLVRDHLEGRTPQYESEHRMRHKDGHYVWILDRGMTFERDANGNPKRMVGTHFDISDRKRVENDLQQANQQLELALKAGNMGVSSRSLDGRTLSWDDRMDEIFAVPAEVKQRGVDQAFFRSRLHPDDVAVLEKFRCDAESSGQPTEAVYRIVLPEAGIRFIHSMMLCTRDADVPKAIIVNRDITPRMLAVQAVNDARRKAEQANVELARHKADLETTVSQRTEELSAALERAQSADRAKTAFLAMTSHELRTPLNAINGFSQLVRDEVMGPVNDEQRRALDIVHRSGVQLLALVKDILDAAVVEGGKIALDLVPVDLRQLLEEQVDVLALLAAEHRLELRLVDCSPLITVRSDPRRLGQVVRNLVSNAIAYTEQGHIIVRARVEDGMARVEVEDSGVGIPPDQHHKLFRAFTPVAGQATTGRQTTGLGLAIARGIVEASGGKIGVTSEPGHGSTFWFTVPLHAEPTQRGMTVE